MRPLVQNNQFSGEGKKGGEGCRIQNGPPYDGEVNDMTCAYHVTFFTCETHVILHVMSLTSPSCTKSPPCGGTKHFQNIQKTFSIPPVWLNGSTLGKWVADRTMKSRTIQAVPNFFLPAAPCFIFCSAKKGSLSDSVV